jgi:hypothetical protein
MRDIGVNGSICPDADQGYIPGIWSDELDHGLVSFSEGLQSGTSVSVPASQPL